MRPYGVGGPFVYVLLLLVLDSGIRSTRHTQAGEHGGFLLPYTEIFPGHAVPYMADLAITHIKRVYVLHANSQS